MLCQQLASPQFTRPEEVVSHMGALQAQEYRLMRWAVALRTQQLGHLLSGHPLRRPRLRHLETLCPATLRRNVRRRHASPIPRHRLAGLPGLPDPLTPDAALISRRAYAPFLPRRQPESLQLVVMEPNRAFCLEKRSRRQCGPTHVVFVTKVNGTLQKDWALRLPVAKFVHYYVRNNSAVWLSSVQRNSIKSSYQSKEKRAQSF